MSLFSALRLFPLLLAFGLTGCAGMMQDTPPPRTMAQAQPQPPAKPVAPPPVFAQTMSAPPHAGPAAKVKVAILLPLTGPNAAIGQGMLDAANLAVFDLADKSFDLLPEDTGDTSEAAVKAAQSAVNSGAKLILGPLFASATASVKPVARDAGLKIISFTTDASEAGDNVYVMGFLPGTQIDRVAAYAAQHGVTQVAALVPSSAYGTAALTSLQADFPVGLAAAAQYRPDGSDAVAQLDSLDVPAKANGLFLAEGGDRLKAIAKALPAAGIDPAKVHLLGTGLWDDPAVAQEPALLGGWYAGVAPATRAAFERKFDNTYHYKPPRLVTLAYDATALAIVLAKQTPQGQPPYADAALTKETGFVGTDGIIRFHDNGLNERGLSVLQIAPSGPVVIDPAPKSFVVGARTGM